VDAVRRHLEALLWRDGAICAHRGTSDKSSVLKGKSTRAGLRWCNARRKPFRVTAGTVFENSKVPLNVWLHANHLLCGHPALGRLEQSQQDCILTLLAG